MDQRQKFLGLAALSVVSILVWNAWGWKSYVDLLRENGNLVDGTCNIESNTYHKSGLKNLWSVPVIGPKWTNVPCLMNVTVLDSNGGTVATKTHLWVTFIYMQGFVANVFVDTCAQIVPALQHDFFPCTYSVGADGKLPVLPVWDGQVIDSTVVELPPLTKVKLMHAMLLSTLTLLPIALIAVCAVKTMLMGTTTAAKANDFSPLPGGPAQDGGAEPA